MCVILSNICRVLQIRGKWGWGGVKLSWVEWAEWAQIGDQREDPLFAIIRPWTPAYWVICYLNDNDRSYPCRLNVQRKIYFQVLHQVLNKQQRKCTNFFKSVGKYFQYSLWKLQVTANESAASQMNAVDLHKGGALCFSVPSSACSC